MAKRNPGAETSEKLTGLKKKRPKQTAAGRKSIISSLQHVRREMPWGKGVKILRKLNQQGGIDCPGCAWPDPDDDRSKLGEYCENGVKAIAEEATSRRLLPSFFAENSVAQLGKLSDFEIGKQGRIAQPMFLPVGAQHYEEISWHDAFALVAKNLQRLDSPDEAIFYTSGRTSNEAAFLYQLFVREFGTNNMPDCSNMCHESSGAALGSTLGIGKGSVKLEDFYQTEVIMVMGQNPGTNHPRMLSALQKAKRNGAKIVVVNPIREAGLLGFSNPQEISGLLGGSTQLADHYLQVRINSDLALLQALEYELVDRDKKAPGTILDRDFIAEQTFGSEEFIQHVNALDINALVAQTGLDWNTIAPVADLLAESQNIIVCWAMGLTQHKNAVNTIKEVVNLLLLKGSIGKPGAGTCPVRGHSNVQGDRTMGIIERPSAQLLEQIESNFGFTPPAHHGYDTVNSIKAMHDGKVRIFFGLGGNFLSATPDTLYTAEALQNCDLTVHVSTKLNRSHLVHGREALILPCLARTDKDVQSGHEQFVSVENSMGVVHSSRGVLEPISDKLLSEPAIICGMARHTIPASKVDWDSMLKSYDVIRDHIEQTVQGFENYNARVREPGGFYLPNGARDGNFRTASGKAEFTISPVEPIELEPDEFLMMTIRSHDQFNTTIYGLDDRYRGVYQERRVVLINRADLERLSLREYDLVDLLNFDGQIERIAPKFVIISYDIPNGCIATYFPEANVLVPISKTADISNTPASKSVVVQIRPHSS